MKVPSDSVVVAPSVAHDDATGESPVGTSAAMLPPTTADEKEFRCEGPGIDRWMTAVEFGTMLHHLFPTGTAKPVALGSLCFNRRASVRIVGAGGRNYCPAHRQFIKKVIHILLVYGWMWCD
jgi:hypothetical protein